MKRINAKKGVIFGIIVFLLAYSINFANSLSVSPAKIEMNFQPDFEKSITYKVGRTSPDMPIFISIEGDLAKYVQLDKTNFTGPGTFNANLKLPSEISVPGKHRIKIVVSERPDQKKRRDMISTAIIIKVVIDVFVPYPGKYLEITEFNANNVNVGEVVNFDLTIENKGKENLNLVKPRIVINDNSGKTLKLMNLGEYSLEKSKELKLREKLNTSDFNPGIYSAKVIVDYDGGFAQKNRTVKIGDLIVYIKKYTENISIGGFKKFSIDVESGWNNKIDGVYADVIILNNSKEMQEFKTSTETLSPWNTKTIEGYLNTTGFSPGTYNANITLYYYGKEQGKSSSKIVKVNFYKPKKQNNIYFIAGAIFIIVAVVLFFAIKKIRNK